MTRTYYARAKAGKNLAQVLDATVQFCAYMGLKILRISYGPVCCEVVVEV